ncbi:anaerobic ribonucleoside-triphosphate reductase activating protein [Schaalia vaccimaxillae]|uniref:anaerobic ribonucleoside-triphosphate reductase activating protein n=1 Tax=Schaalia vaccimaxillae TaxID=183916 RepID=UPI000479D5A3|nr:anaerobic ribonucleoside-triphosphate reductase activating protein [Schaalia vaccimaxillae]
MRSPSSSSHEVGPVPLGMPEREGGARPRTSRLAANARGRRIPTAFTPDDLQIAGLVPMSTVDWPGKFAASLFLQGCPWLCPYCQNSAIIDPKIPGVVAWSALEDLLARRHGLLDGVVFSGGEATRQIALGAGMRRVRELGFGVGLHTAGPYPTRLRELLDEGLVDWVGIDVKAMADNYETVAGRPGAGAKAWESLGIVLDHGEVDHEVRLTVYPDGPRDGLEVAHRALEAGARVFALQQARQVGTPNGFSSQAHGWDDQVQALAADIELLGFERFVYRPA